MRHRRSVWLAVVVCLAGALSVGAQQDPTEMDPLLELLVEQGVITQEQAEAVQAEYDRRQTPSRLPSRGREPPVAPTQPVVAEMVAPVEEEAKPKAEKWYDRIDFKGDLRLRFEAFKMAGISEDDRRERFRVRIRPGHLHRHHRLDGCRPPAAQRRPR